MSINTFEIPLINSFRFFQQSRLTGTLTNSLIDLAGFELKYNNRPFDKDFFIQNLHEWQDNISFVQKYQRTDNPPIYFKFGATISDYSLNILDQNGSVIKSVPYVDFTSISVGGQTAFAYHIPVYELDDGLYYLQLKFNNPGEDIYFISEPFEIKEKHEGTVLLEYRNSYSTHNVLFEELPSKWRFQMRVNAALTEMTPATDAETYDAQQKDQILLSATPYRDWKFVLGGNGVLSCEWEADKVNRALSCDDFKIEGINYTLIGDSTLEPSRIRNTALQSWETTLRTRYNEDSVEMLYHQGFNHHFGILPETERLYVSNFTNTVSSLIIEKEFIGVTAFCNYMTNLINDTYGLNGFLTLNSVRDLIYVCSDDVDQAWFATKSPAINGLCTSWVSLELEADLGVTVGINNTTLSAVIWGDGTVTNYSATANKTHTYTFVGNVKLYCYFFTTEVSLDLSTGNSSAYAIDGNIGENLVSLKCEGESLKTVGNKLFSYNKAGNLNVLSFQDNKLNSAEVSKLIIMTQDGVINDRVDNSGVLTLDLQTPSAPPTGGSLQGVLSNLRDNWTVNTD